MEFKEFDKIPRLKRDIIITEKIDGTNAQVYIISATEIMEKADPTFTHEYSLSFDLNTKCYMFAGSRTRWIKPGKEFDNYGFAGWVKENSEELFKLGEGRHYGEWFGKGIQRGYGIDKKVFALFNTGRWFKTTADMKYVYEGCPAILPLTPCPDCCDVVPVLYRGDFDTRAIDDCLADLRTGGSKAVSGYTNAEGIVVYHVASRSLYKVTLEKDNQPKSLTN